MSINLSLACAVRWEVTYNSWDLLQFDFFVWYICKHYIKGKSIIFWEKYEMVALPALFYSVISWLVA